MRKEGNRNTTATSKSRTIIGIIASVIVIGVVITLCLSIKSNKANSEAASNADSTLVKDTIYKYGLPIEYFTCSTTPFSLARHLLTFS